MSTLFTLGKLGCLAVYAVGLATLAGGLHGPLATGVGWLGVAFVAVHVLELPIFWQALRRYPGSFASSVLQSLLFGVFHSLPLKRAAQA